MVSISSIGSQAIGGITKFKPVQKACNYFDKDLSKALAYSTIASVLFKDGIGCYMYVTQSLHNKKIPEDKRKFVAAYDLTNGILMMSTQVLCFFAMRKINKGMFNKLFSKSFDKNGEVLKNISTQIRMEEAAKGTKPEEISRKISIAKEYLNIKKNCFGLFSFVTELAAATIFAKRVLVPMISTPLAKKVEKKMGISKNGASIKPEDKQANKQEAKVDDKPEAKKLDITSTDTNLLNRYKK
jgi:hypothetical protein